MTTDPDKIDPEKGDPDGKSKWSPGEGADGSIAIYTPDEAARLIGERNADEAAFNELLIEPGETLPVDLDSMTSEELDELIEGLDAQSDAA
jgi:hypothetical protein